MHHILSQYDELLESDAYVIGSKDEARKMDNPMHDTGVEQNGRAEEMELD
jgi:hypothetical protein